MRYLIIISLFFLVGCEDEKNFDYISKYPIRANDVEFSLNVLESDMSVCDEVGYSDTILLTSNNRYGFPDLDEENLIQIFNDFPDFSRTNTIVYEFEEINDFPYIRVASTSRAFYHHELEKLLFNEDCVYDLIKGEL